MIGAVSKRFASTASVSIGCIVVTGLALIIAVRRSFGPGAADDVWQSPLGLKIFLVMVMILAHFYGTLFLPQE